MSVASRGGVRRPLQMQDYDERDVHVIEEFLQSLPSMTKKREDKHRGYLLKARRDFLGKPLEECTQQDLKRFVQDLDSKTDFEPWTKHDYRFIVKRFFRWMRDAEFVSVIKVGLPAATVGPEDIFSENELLRVFGACKSPRDKAMAHTLYEGALRPHEFLGLRKNDVAFDQHGAKVYVRASSDVHGVEKKAKTGPRTLRVLNASAYLANWIENHPYKERDAPLWIEAAHGAHGRPLRWAGLNKIIYRWSRDAKVEKHISAYIFRHTRLTELAKTLTEARLCNFAGWTIGSAMPRMYVHLSGRDTDDAILQAAGIVKDGDAKVVALPKTCVRCGNVNPAEGESCSKCGMPLSLKAALRTDEDLQQMKQTLQDVLKDMAALKHEMGLA